MDMCITANGCSLWRRERKEIECRECCSSSKRGNWFIRVACGGILLGRLLRRSFMIALECVCYRLFLHGYFNHRCFRFIAPISVISSYYDTIWRNAGTSISDILEVFSGEVLRLYVQVTDLDDNIGTKNDMAFFMFFCFNTRWEGCRNVTWCMFSWIHSKVPLHSGVCIVLERERLFWVFVLLLVRLEIYCILLLVEECAQRMWKRGNV